MNRLRLILIDHTGLRDYSQAMDVAGLSKLSEQAILNLVMVLGFLAHGYATGKLGSTSNIIHLPEIFVSNRRVRGDKPPLGRLSPC
jgi:hypothetical protein